MKKDSFEARQWSLTHTRALVIGLLFLTASCANAMPRVVFLVRHAERVSATDPDSPISEAGFCRARSPAKILVILGHKKKFIL